LGTAALVGETVGAALLGEEMTVGPTALLGDTALSTSVLGGGDMTALLTAVLGELAITALLTTVPPGEVTAVPGEITAWLTAVLGEATTALLTAVLGEVITALLTAELGRTALLWGGEMTALLTAAIPVLTTAGCRAAAVGGRGCWGSRATTLSIWSS